MAVKSKYQPFSFQERITPLLMLQEQYDKMNENLASFGEQANQYYQILDPDTRAAVDNYNGQLQSVADSLSSQGLKGVSRTTLFNLKRMYNDQVRPINNAAKTLSEMYNSQRDLEMKMSASGQQVFTTKMPTVKELLENPNAAPRNVGSGALYNQGLQASKSASMRRFSESSFGDEIIRGYIRMVKEQGYSPQVVAEFMNDVNTIPELREAYESIREMYGTAALNNPAGADQFIMRGLLDGMLYNRDTEYKEDIIGKENRAFARQKALATLNADLDLRNALAKAAGKESSSSNRKTIVSPRAVSTVSQQFYDSKTNTVSVPDYLFDKNGHLVPPKTQKGKLFGLEIKTGSRGYTPGELAIGKEGLEYDARQVQYNAIMKALGEQYSEEQIANMNKSDVVNALEGIVHNSLQDAEGNSGYYWNLDIANTKELLSRVGPLYKVDGKENGQWTYSKVEKDAKSEFKDHGSQLVYDPVSNELFITSDNGREMYRLEKSTIADQDLLEAIDVYHRLNPDLGNINLLQGASNTMDEQLSIMSAFDEKLNRGERLSAEEQKEYMTAYERYNQAVQVKEGADATFSSIGPTIMSYLKKIQ